MNTSQGELKPISIILSYGWLINTFTARIQFAFVLRFRVKTDVVFVVAIQLFFNAYMDDYTLIINHSSQLIVSHTMTNEWRMQFDFATWYATKNNKAESLSWSFLDLYLLMARDLCVNLRERWFSNSSRVFPQHSQFDFANRSNEPSIVADTVSTAH